MPIKENDKYVDMVFPFQAQLHVDQDYLLSRILSSRDDILSDTQLFGRSRSLFSGSSDDGGELALNLAKRLNMQVKINHNQPKFKPFEPCNLRNQEPSSHTYTVS